MSQARGGQARGSGAWITEWREARGLTLEELGTALRRYGRKRRPGNDVVISNKLIYILETVPGAVTHPGLAGIICDALGARPKDWRAIVHRKHWGEGYRAKDRAMIAAPVARPRKDDIKAEAAKMAARKGLYTRRVVMIDRAARVVREYASVAQAAWDSCCSEDMILNRVWRKVHAKEFTPQSNCTYRYADEWETMTEGERYADVYHLAGRAGDEEKGWRVGVVAIDREGRELGRYKGFNECARARGTTHTAVAKRARRHIVGDEYRLRGETYRLDIEWDAMTAEQRAMDVRAAATDDGDATTEEGDSDGEEAGQDDAGKGDAGDVGERDAEAGGADVGGQGRGGEGGRRDDAGDAAGDDERGGRGARDGRGEVGARVLSGAGAARTGKKDRDGLRDDGRGGQGADPGILGVRGDGGDRGGAGGGDRIRHDGGGRSAAQSGEAIGDDGPGGRGRSVRPGRTAGGGVS